MIVVLPDPLDNDGEPIPPCGGREGSGTGTSPEMSIEELLANGFDLTRFPQPEPLMDNAPDTTLEEKLQALGVDVCTDCGPPKHD